MMGSRRVGYCLAAAFVLLSAARDFGVQSRPLTVYFLILVAFLPAALLAVCSMLAWPRPWPAGRRPAAGGSMALGGGLSLRSWLCAAGNNWLAGRVARVVFGPLPVFAARFWLLLVVAGGWASLDGFAGVPVAAGDWAFAALVGLLGI